VYRSVVSSSWFVVRVCRAKRGEANLSGLFACLYVYLPVCLPCLSVSLSVGRIPKEREKRDKERKGGGVAMMIEIERRRRRKRATTRKMRMRMRG